MSEVEPVSTSALYQAEIAQLNAIIARQARQITEQSLYIGQLTKQVFCEKQALAELRARQPLRCNGRRGYARPGDP